MFRPLLCVTILLCLLLCGAHSQVDWRQLPYGDNTFNTDAKFDTNVTLQCNDSTLTGDFRFQYWIRPDTTVMRGGDFERFRILDGYAWWEASPDGMELWVVALQQRQFGIYLCVGETPDGAGDRVTKVIKRGLNYAAPYFGDLWPEYKINTIIGLSAAGGFLVIVAVMAATYHFRYTVEDEDEDGEPEVTCDAPLETVATSDGSGLQYRNPTYDVTTTEL